MTSNKWMNREEYLKSLYYRDILKLKKRWKSKAYYNLVTLLFSFIMAVYAYKFFPIYYFNFRNLIFNTTTLLRISSVFVLIPEFIGLYKVINYLDSMDKELESRK